MLSAARRRACCEAGCRQRSEAGERLRYTINHATEREFLSQWVVPFLALFSFTTVSAFASCLRDAAAATMLTTPQRTSGSMAPRWKRLQLIGSGASGQVFLAVEDAESTDHSPTRSTDGARREPPTYRVIKRLFLDASDDDIMAAAAVEVKVLRSLPPHRCLLRHFDDFVDSDGYLNLVLEYGDLGDLERFMTRRRKAGRPFSPAEVVHLAFELLCGVRHLHRHRVMHRDIKPSNILVLHSAGSGHCREEKAAEKRRASNAANSDAVDEHAEPSLPGPGTGLLDDPPTSDSVSLRLADFGISRVMQTGSLRAHTVIGTPNYISPEMCESQPYTYSSDMWAVGCVIFEMCGTGREKLFGGENMMAVVCKIAAANVPTLPAPFDVLQPLVAAFVRTAPEARMTAEQALQHFFGAQPIEGKQ